MKSFGTRSSVLVAIAALSLAAAGSAPARAESWQIDTAHSEVNFTVDHFFTPVNGTFDAFDAEFSFDADDPAKSSVRVTIPVASINTRNDRRDGHLRSPDFFNAEEHGEITFESTSVRAAGENQMIATGPLTIKGITKEVELPITLLGIKEIPEEMQQMLGGAKRIASFEATTTLDRGDYEVGTGNWAATLVVGGEVDIRIVVEAHLK